MRAGDIVVLVAGAALAAGVVAFFAEPPIEPALIARVLVVYDPTFRLP